MAHKTYKRDIFEDAKTRTEVTTRSGLDWTLARTSLLTNSRPRGVYRAGSMGEVRGVRISRGDMAEFMLACVADGRYVGEMPYVSCD